MRHTTRHYSVGSDRVLPEARRICNEVSEATTSKNVSTEADLSPLVVAQLSRWYPRLCTVSDVDIFISRLLANHGDGEMGFSTLFSPELIDASCRRGVFPLAISLGNSFVYGPKLHCQRYLTYLQSGVGGLSVGSDGGEGMFTASHLQVSRKYMRERNSCTQVASYDVFVNRREDIVSVLSLIHAQHGENWLCRQLRTCFVHMFVNREKYCTKIVFMAIRRHRYDDESGTEIQDGGSNCLPDRVHGECVEAGDLVAAEVGYVVGDIYTSASGAYCASGAGTLQLAVAGEVMRSVGCKVWDLGMGMDYKVKGIGCVPVERKQWLKLVFDCTRDITLSESIDSKLRDGFAGGVAVRKLLR